MAEWPPIGKYLLTRGLYSILPVPNIYTMERYSVTSQLSSTYSAHHAKHIGTKSMHIFADSSGLS